MRSYEGTHCWNNNTVCLSQIMVKHIDQGDQLGHVVNASTPSYPEVQDHSVSHIIAWSLEASSAILCHLTTYFLGCIFKRSSRKCGMMY